MRHHPFCVKHIFYTFSAYLFLKSISTVFDKCIKIGNKCRQITVYLQTKITARAEVVSLHGRWGYLLF